MLSHIIYSLSFKMVYIVYLCQKKGGGGPPWPPSKSATVLCDVEIYYVFVGLGFFSTIVTFILFHQPKGGKRRVQVNNLWENIDILRTEISMFWLWTKLLHILLYHCSRICRFPMSYIFLQNLFADNLSRVKTELPATPTVVTITYFRWCCLEKDTISHISTLNSNP